MSTLPFVILHVEKQKNKGDFVVKNQKGKLKRYRGFIDFEFQSAMGQRKADLISVGLVIYDTKDKQVVNEFYSLIRPSRPITKRVSKLTGLTNEELKTADEWLMVSKRLEQKLKPYRNEIFIYAYSDNDARTVEQVCQKYRIRNIFKGDFKIRDASLIILRRMKIFGHSLFEEMPSLSRIASYYGVDFKNKHNALEDARILGIIFEKTMEGVFAKRRLCIPFLAAQVAPFIKDLEWSGCIFNTVSLKEDGSLELFVWQKNYKYKIPLNKRKGRYELKEVKNYHKLSSTKKQLVNRVLILLSFNEKELTKLLPA